MAESSILCYITDRSAFPGDERARRLSLLEKIAETASYGIDYIQLREKDLSARELEALAREAVSIVRKVETKSRGLRTALLINSRTDVAMAAGADGVHLRADDISPDDVRASWTSAMRDARAPYTSLMATSTSEVLPRNPLIAVSCHSPQEVAQAAANHATFAVLAPVFEKKDSPMTNPVGLDGLREACAAGIPVLALGGVTLQNAQSCLRAGAAGIAAIRLFQENDMVTIVRDLRG